MQTTDDIINDVMLQFSPWFELLGEHMEHSDLKCKDCIHAKFLDWVSDIYGRELISKIFPLIESCDLDNKKEVNIVIERHKTWNEYTNNEIKDLIQIFNIDIPDSFALEIEKCKDDKEAAIIGEKWTIHQAKELLKGGVPCLHFYTMSKVDGFVRIAKEVL